jgi:hypothetical protein
LGGGVFLVSIIISLALGVVYYFFKAKRWQDTSSEANELEILARYEQSQRKGK